MSARSHANVTNTTQADSAVKTSLLKHAGVKLIEAEPKQQPGEEAEKNVVRQSRFKQDFSRIPVSALSTPVVQPKLVVGRADDRYEQEADRVAEQVMRMPNQSTIPGQGRFGSVQPLSIQHLKSDTSKKLQRQAEKSDESDEEETVQAKFLPSLSIEPLNSPLGERIQRQADESGEAATEEEEEEKEEEEEPVQTKSILHQTPSVTPDLASRLKVSQGMGQPLPSATREFMEPRFNHDFSRRVRVHTDGQANQMARGLNAQAFTFKQDIYFGAGYYQPHTKSGKRLLAHELTHTIQQQPPPILRSPHPALFPPAFSQRYDSSEQEAESVSDQIAQNALVAPGTISEGTPGAQHLISLRRNTPSVSEPSAFSSESFVPTEAPTVSEPSLAPLSSEGTADKAARINADRGDVASKQKVEAKLKDTENCPAHRRRIRHQKLQLRSHNPLRLREKRLRKLNRSL
jgi:hypothetical protein